MHCHNDRTRDEGRRCGDGEAVEKAYQAFWFFRKKSFRSLRALILSSRITQTMRLP
jgi:hypothetical protein